MIAQVTNWSAVGALSGVGAVFVALLGLFVNHKTTQSSQKIDDVARRITTPDNLPPIGQATGDLLAALNAHAEDNSRHLVVKKAPAKKATKRA